MTPERLLFAVSDPARYEAIRVVLAESFTLRLAETRWDADSAVDEGPDIMLVEQVLPGGRGLRICERARSRADGKDRLIVAIGDADTAAVEEATLARVIDGWIPRNLAPGAFLTRFWALYGRRDDRRLMMAAGPEAKPLVERGRALFAELDGGMITGRTRALLSETATRVVTFADACSASSLLELLQGHHAYTFAHSLRVGILMATFGRHLGLDDENVTLMAETGLAHDVGKLRVPLEILAKPCRLTADEMTVMRSHPVIGADMLREVYHDQPGLLAAVRHHHEQLSGDGYPNGLKGGQIDELSLLTAVVDVYTALTDRRDYKAPMSMVEAISVMDCMAGPHLEPRLYRRFLEVIRELDASNSASTVAA
ncbi:HD domain-containing phosphohydrolase [Thalassobaculum sp.]|uniref:HD-GYP domain-containing protein n=1 Tax=Thalassobaculum sp. TaxID=2022740 RepID=UPI0032F031B3